MKFLLETKCPASITREISFDLTADLVGLEKEGFF